MSNKLTGLKIEYTKLTSSEKQELKKFINEFDGKSEFEKGQVNENLRKSLGPINSTACPVCGK
ncbi:hypothetical protein QSE00_24910 [Arenibacter sp. M-2]|uniref:hypothetical protein n=1 Tax=Arenibacter sp. M-2 TaxID=3053612 RepID=UPI002570BF6A|nr:hypothetical protein [Arenibacter sp. M-2]MDL5515075.1 hypothetical protein [Arenibacter sp. M-2]